MGNGFILFVGLPALFQILAAIQVGRARYGGLYLGLAVLGTGVQALILLLSVPAAAIPFVGVLIIEIVLLLRPTARPRIGAGSNPKRSWLPDVVGLPVGLAMVAGLMAWNHVAFDPDNRHPHRDFDSSEAGSRIEDAIESTLPVFSEEQEFEIGDGNPDSCYDGVAYDTEYESFRLEYLLVPGHQNPKQLFAEYVDVIRRHWESLDYEIIRDEVDSGIRDHVLEAERPDGVRLIFALYYDGAYVALSADSGCVKIADQQ
jgi:hypothetical protein